MQDRLPEAVRILQISSPWLQIEFEQGSVRWFDTSEFFAYPFFQPLRDRRLFDRASIAYGTVVWPGDIDIAPETLWLCSVADKSSDAQGLMTAGGDAVMGPT